MIRSLSAHSEWLNTVVFTLEQLTWIQYNSTHTDAGCRAEMILVHQRTLSWLQGDSHLEWSHLWGKNNPIRENPTYNLSHGGWGGGGCSKDLLSLCPSKRFSYLLSRLYGREMIWLEGQPKCGAWGNKGAQNTLQPLGSIPEPNLSLYWCSGLVKRMRHTLENDSTVFITSTFLTSLFPTFIIVISYCAIPLLSFCVPEYIWEFSTRALANLSSVVGYIFQKHISELGI